MTKGGSRRADYDLVRVFYYKRRNADGMLFSPQTVWEWRLWRDFDISHRRAQGEQVDLGDILIDLAAVAEELETAGGDSTAAHNHADADGGAANHLTEQLRELRATLAASRERTESAQGTLLAKAGNPPPSGLMEAAKMIADSIAASTSHEERISLAIDDIEEALAKIASVHQDAATTARLQYQAAQEINDYAGRLQG